MAHRETVIRRDFLAVEGTLRNKNILKEFILSCERAIKLRLRKALSHTHTDTHSHTHSQTHKQEMIIGHSG